jgi:glycosyltransferase involved in cell wall biosynthesis
MDHPRKKILYVITKSNFGGAQRYVHELAQETMRSGYETVVACGGNGILVQKLTDAGIRVRIVDSFERDIHIQKEFSAFSELRRIIREERPDIIHLNSSKAAGIGALIARLSRVSAIIFTAHGWPYFEERNFLSRALIWFLSYVTVLLCHRTIVVSAYDQTHTYMPLQGRKIVHISTAIPAISFLDREHARQQLYSETIRTQHAHDCWAVSTGEFTANKNLFALLSAVQQHNIHADRKVFLTLVGDGEERTMLREHVDLLGIGEYVHFAGYVDNVRLYLKAFDVFLLPSKKEGLPYGLLEAGAAELGCIASHVGGIPEIISSSEYGILINPHNTKEITQALTRYATHPEQARSAGERLAIHVHATFNMATMLRKTISLYEGATSRAT